MIENIQKYQIIAKSLIRDSIKQMDEGGIGFCVCVDEKNRVFGVISDGDFHW